MKIFLDFDDVVFDTKQFNIDRIKIFNDHGIAKKIFNQYFEEFKAKRKNGELITYSQEKHIQSIEGLPSLEVNFDALRKALSEFMKDLKRYVFESFKEFAKKVDKENLFLVSYGDIEFQKEKIKNSRIEEYFNEVIITEGKKSEAIAERFKNEKGEIKTGKTVIADDRPIHLKDIKESPETKEIMTVLMRTGKGRHNNEQGDKFCDKVVKNFDELGKLLEIDSELKQEFYEFKKA